MKKKTHCLKGHEYTPDNTYEDCRGHRGCKICRRDAVDRHYLNHRDDVLSKKKQRRAVNPDITPEERRENNLKYIGWTTELFNSTLEEQQGRCAICNKILNLEKKQNSARACADHEHIKPPKPRGVLCTNCNIGIGNLQDDIGILLKAVEYLRRYN